MTVLEIRPHRWGWKVFESPGVEPVSLNQQDAIDYATGQRVLPLWRDSHSGLRSSGTSPQTFRIKVKGRGGQWKIAGERDSILVNLAPSFCLFT